MLQNCVYYGLAFTWTLSPVHQIFQSIFACMTLIATQCVVACLFRPAVVNSSTFIYIVALIIYFPKTIAASTRVASLCVAACFSWVFIATVVSVFFTLVNIWNGQSYSQICWNGEKQNETKRCRLLLIFTKNAKILKLL